MTTSSRFILLAGVAVFLAFAFPHPARADTVITNCSNEAQLNAALAISGVIKFDCGKATILFTTKKHITNDITIDGGSKITFSANNTLSHFKVSKSGKLTLKNITLSNGFREGNGGSIQNSGTLVLENAILRQNSIAGDWNGGAIFSSGSLAIKKSRFESNKAARGGGAIAISKGLASIAETVFYANEVTGLGGLSWGGAIQNSGNLVLLNSTFDSNKSADLGGGVGSGGALVATNVTFVRNHSGSGGGGLSLKAVDDPTTLANVTFSQNVAVHRGGGLYLFEGSVSLKNVTFSGNSAPLGGGIAISDLNMPDWKLSLTNTILNAGRVGSNCYDPSNNIKSKGFNLSSDDSCALDESTDQDNVNPKLLPLANNGGSTQTHLLAPDSPAIDAGTGLNVNQQDQRGIARPEGNAVDIGAVEVKSTEPCWDTPPNPLLHKPRPITVLKIQPVKFDWQDTLCAAKYKLIIQLYPPDGVTEWKIKGLDFSQYSFADLTGGKPYRWRVQGCNGGKCGKSIWWMFEL